MCAESRLRGICVEFAGAPGIAGYLQLRTEALFSAQARLPFYLARKWPAYAGRFGQFSVAIRYRDAPSFERDREKEREGEKEREREATCPRRRRKMWDIGDNSALFAEAT